MSQASVCTVCAKGLWFRDEMLGTFADRLVSQQTKLPRVTCRFDNVAMCVTSWSFYTTADHSDRFLKGVQMTRFEEI
jgi:hypothetical protein